MRYARNSMLYVPYNISGYVACLLSVGWTAAVNVLLAFPSAVDRIADSGGGAHARAEAAKGSDLRVQTLEQ